MTKEDQLLNRSEIIRMVRVRLHALTELDAAIRARGETTSRGQA